MPNFGPPIPGLTKADAPLTGSDMVGKLAGLMGGKPAMPQMSAGDKVAQAVQLLREAGAEDPRLAPILAQALQSLVTGPPSGPNAPPAGPVQGPVPQAMGMGGGGPGGGPIGQLSAMMGGG